ncbi:MAG: Cna B-type domain-containing protein, partial [Bacteroides sp.]
PTVTRPDLVPVLYEQFEKAVPGSNPTTVTRQITNYVDRDWDTQTKPGKQWWQCTFASLPKYTGEGYEISYFVGETVAVPGDFSYQAFYPEVPSERGSFAENSGSRLKDNLKLTDEAGVENGTTVSAAPLGGTIVNKLEANRTLSGLKIWKGMPEGLGAQWYPTVKFGLYKASDAPNPDSPVDPAKALDHVTLEKGATAFAFAKPVPKYDTEGKMIEYVVREEAPENIGVFYDITSDTTVGYQITNTFLTDQNYTINFDKTWEDVPSGLKDKQLPSVTLTLVRYMKNALTGIDDPTTKVTLTDTAITLAYDGTTVKQAASWKELPYYAPNGKPYTYQVEESSLNGYNKLGPIDVMGTYDDDAKIGAGAARATNTYNGGRSIGFTLEKKWSGDSAYDLNQRPASVQLELHRKTPGTTPAFDEQVTKPLELNAADTWQHTVAESDLVDSIDPKLVEYASNGEAYTYYLKELSTEGYMVTSTEVKPAADDKETSFSLVATNTVKTQSLKAVKAWQKTVGGVSTSLTGDEMLFAYQLGALPSSITYNVEYSVDAGAS